MGAPIHTLHANFNGGEMTPLMLGRFDTDKLRSGCRTLKNFIVRPYGGVFKRPGTRYVGATKTAANKARLIAFKRSTSTNYVLELGDFYMRLWKGGSSPSQVTVSGVSAWAANTAYAQGALVSNGGTNYYCKVAHTSGSVFSGAGTNWYALTGSIFEIPTSWALADIFDLQFTQINDVMFFTHPSYPPYRFSRFAETNCVLELVPFTFAPSLDVNTSRTAVQIQRNISAWVTSTAYAVGAQVTSTQTVGSGTSVTSTYTEVYTCTVAHTSGSTTQPGVGASWTSNWNLGTSTQIAAAWVTATSYTAGQFVKDNNVTYKCTTSHTSGATSEPGVGGLWASYWTVYGGDYDRGSYTYNLVSTDAVFTSADVGNTWLVQIGMQSYYRATSLVTTPAVVTTKGIFIQGDCLVTTNWTAGNAMVGPLFLESSTDMTTWNRIREWDITNQSDDNISHMETAPETGAYYRVGGVAASSAGAGTIFKIAPISNVITVPFVITGYTSATQVTGYPVMPGGQRLPTEAVGIYTTLYRKPAFSPTSGYPRTVAFHASRLWFAGTSSNPGRLWASETDNFYTFLNGTLDTSAIDRTLGAQESNEIRWIKSRGKLLVVGTTGEEWTIDSGDTDIVLTNTNIRARRQTNYGSSGLAAELIIDALLWVARGGRRIHEFSYQFASDQFVAPDMNVLAEHITQGGVVQTAFQAAPDPIFWCVMGTGTLAGFSYNREQGITAWHRHTTGDATSDAFESIATIYGSGVSDEVWFTVKRTIGGTTVRYVERFDPQVFQWNTEQGGSMDGLAWCDCAIAGTIGSTVVNSGGNCSINGFTALNGRTVTMLAGTSAGTSAATVSAGGASFTGFTATGTTPIIGLPITSVLEPMPIDISLPDGTAQGRHFRPNRVHFIFNQAAGGSYADGPSGTFYNLGYDSGSTFPFTGRLTQHIESTFAREITFTIQHVDPYPFGMLGYILMTEVEGQ